ncbi:paternally-expressed gene 3 protein [Aplysia californica]|uniref:Paternally-expressed gene 3 protein n=1 Tax=Aplysia californica TaxID=6500 RepID=A0ABM0JYM3_APLCA|nr:paternally-expressed gene 3 protein [Aplysia californica]
MDPLQDSMRDQPNPGTTELSISQILSEFKSTLSRRNTNCKGKLTITLGETSGVDIKFQPHQTGTLGTQSYLPPTNSSENQRAYEQRFLVPQTTLRSSLCPQQNYIPTVADHSASREDSTAGWLSKNIPVSLLSDSHVDNPAGPAVVYNHPPAMGFTTSNIHSSQELTSVSSGIQLKSLENACLPSISSSHIGHFPTSLPTSALTSLPPFEKIIEQRFPLLMSNYSQPESMTSFQDITSTFLFNNPPQLTTSPTGPKILEDSAQYQHVLDDNNHALGDNQRMENLLNEQTTSLSMEHLPPSCTRQQNVNDVPKLARQHMVERNFVVDFPTHPKESGEDSVRISTSQEHPALSKGPIPEKVLCPSSESEKKSPSEQSCQRNITVEDLKSGKVSTEDLRSMSHDELIALLVLVMDFFNSSGESTLKKSKECESKSRKVPEPLKNDSDSVSKEAAQVHEEQSAAVKANIDSPAAATRPKRKTYKPLRTDQDEMTEIDSGKGKFSFSVDGGLVPPLAPQEDDKMLRGNRRVKKKAFNAPEKNSKSEDIDTPTQPLKKRNRLRAIIKNDDADQVISFEEKTNSNEIIDQETSNIEMEAGNVTANSRTFKKVARKSSERKEKCFTCKECFKSFSSKLLYRQHVRTHSTGYQCDVCGKTLKTKDSLYHHHRGLHSKDKPYQCRECNASFSFHHSYKLHLQRHKGERPHKCGICHKTYLTSNHLKVHTEAAHGIGSKVCKICGKTFSYSSSLRLHLYSHSENKPHRCDKCGKSFSTKQSLRAHLLTHEESKNFPCNICGKFYKSEHSRSIHCERHKNRIKKFMCDICGKVFLFKSTLKAHTATHSKARPHECQICGKSFKSKASLYTHKYVHKDTYPFLCGICGKSFKSKNCCAAHMKRHENNEKHVCQTCGSSFPDKGGLTKHMKTVHLPKKHFTCTICGKKGTRADNMRTHVKSHRAEISGNPNPMDFILEESVNDMTSSQAQVIIVRPRVRTSGLKNNRKLYPKEKEEDKDKAALVSENDPKERPSVSKGAACVKNEHHLTENLQPNILVAPPTDPQQFPQQTYMLSHNPSYPQHAQSTHLSEMTQQFQPALTHQPQHHVGHDKVPSYLTYLYHHDMASDGHSSGNTPLGPPMSSLLSAMTPLPENDVTGTTQISVSGYNSNTIHSFHASLSDGHSQAGPRVLGSLYTDNMPMSSGLPHLHQAVNQSGPMHDSILLEHEPTMAQLTDAKNSVVFHGGSSTHGIVESGH